MLGLSLGGWLRFFGAGLVAGALLLFIPFKPMGYLAAFVMLAAAAGILIVVVYARLYARVWWLRCGVRVRRVERAWRRQRELAHLRARVIHDAWSPRLIDRSEGGAPP
jgi:hypothetical protein